MRSPLAVRIERVVFHEITGDGPRHLELSDAAVEFGEPLPDADDPIHEYLRRHVAQSLGDAQSVAASFSDAAHPTPHAIFSAFESDRLVDASQSVARRLKEILDADGRISPGTIAILHYVPTFEDGPGARCVGLVKFNPAPGFTMRRTHADAEVTLTLDTVRGVLPSVRERLQKCAFVRPYAEGQGFQILALDRQARSDSLASWFLEDFLDAAPVATDVDRTRAFYLVAAQARDAIGEHLDDDQRRHLDAARASALRGLRIDVNEFVENLGVIEGESKDRYRAIMSERITDPSFVVDRRLAKQLLRQPKFTGDHGLTVKIDRDYLHQVSESLEVEDRTGRSFVKIYTDTWNTPDDAR